jgi:hypothetical protein
MRNQFFAMSHHVDQRSVGMCMATFLLDYISKTTMNDVATLLAAIAAFTTIVYNLQKMFKENKKQ